MIQKTKVFWSSLAPATGGKLRQAACARLREDSLDAAPTVYVCTTCKRADEPDTEPRPGTLLAAATPASYCPCHPLALSD